MNKIKSVFVISLLLACSAFADTLYLKNGQEISDATVIEIGVSEVKYKIGKREVLYIAKKSDIAIIFYKDGTKEVFDSESNGNSMTQSMQNTIIIGGSEAKDDDGNFTKGQRWGTWGLNTIVPGLGSIAIMDDWTGAFVQWGAIGVFGTLGALSTIEASASENFNILVGTLTVGLGVSYIWNIYRSITYNKPVPKTASLANPRNFSFAVMPGRNGNGISYGLMYNAGF
ncbi:MAG: hypothetical protein FWH22_10120 [Fibromonadales bacterium]|nr:hypothetical protein [Fibromonadales bacterium]